MADLSKLPTETLKKLVERNRAMRDAPPCVYGHLDCSCSPVEGGECLDEVCHVIEARECVHESVTTKHGAYCAHCGETLE